MMTRNLTEGLRRRQVKGFDLKAEANLNFELPDRG
jgi:hypothetical protein